MNKIPVFETIAHAYGFAVTQFFRILGIAWAPLLVVTAARLMATPGFLGNHMPVGDPAEIARQSLRLFPFIFALSLLVQAMIGAGVTELALGKRTGTTYVYFSVAAPVWRLIGAWLLFMLVMILIYIGLIILTIVVAIVGAIGIKALALPSSSNMIAVGLLAIFCLLLFLGTLVYTMARLTFLIPPVVVAEGKVDLARGWQLTRGSFWRIFWIGFAIYVPLIAVQVAIALAFYGTGFAHQFVDIMSAGLHSKIGEPAMRHQLDLLSAAARARGLQVWPPMTALLLFVSTFSYGLLYGAAGFAYRAVNPPPSTGTLRDPI